MSTETATPATAAPSHTTPYAWYIASLLSCAYLVAVLDRYLMSVVLEELKRALALSDTQLGILQGPSFVFLLLLASVPFGRLADLTSRKRLIVIGLLCWSFATAACGLVHGYANLLIARMGVGLGEAALMPCAMSLIVAYFSKDKLSRGVSIYSLGASLGRAAAFAGGGAALTWFTLTRGLALPVMGHLEPWRAVFLAAAACGLIFVGLFQLTVREPVRVPRPATGAGLKDGLLYFWGKRWAYLAVFIPYAMAASVAAQLAAWTVSFYVREHGMAASAASSLIGLTGLLLGPTGSLFAGWLNDKLHASGLSNTQPLVITVLLLLILMFTSLLLLSPSLLIAACAFGSAYFCICMSVPTALSGTQLLTPDIHRGTLSSVSLVFTTGLGAAVGPLLVGLVSDYWFDGRNLGDSMLATTVILTVIGMVFGLMGRKTFSRTARNIAALSVA